MPHGPEFADPCRSHCRLACCLLPWLVGLRNKLGKRGRWWYLCLQGWVHGADTGEVGIHDARGLAGLLVAHRDERTLPLKLQIIESVRVTIGPGAKELYQVTVCSTADVELECLYEVWLLGLRMKHTKEEPRDITLFLLLWILEDRTLDAEIISDIKTYGHVLSCWRQRTGDIPSESTTYICVWV